MRNNFGADLKLIVVGKSGTGKTSFVNKWTKNEFNEKYRATIVSEFGYKIVNIDGVIYRIQLWDLAGQDKNTCITKIFCRDAHGVLIVSDCTDRSSLEETSNWKDIIDENTKFIDGSDIPVLLIQNKIDLLDQTQSDDAELKEFAKKHKFGEYFKTSAKTGLNINESMEYLIKIIIRRIQAMGTDYPGKKSIERKGTNIKLKKTEDEFSKKSLNKSCC